MRLVKAGQGAAVTARRVVTRGVMVQKSAAPIVVFRCFTRVADHEGPNMRSRTQQWAARSSTMKPGLHAAREVAAGPVIGIAEAAFHTASLLATGFSVVTTLTRTCVIAEHLVLQYGFERRCRGIHGTDIAVLELDDPASNAFSRILQCAEQALRVDHSSAIVLGCAGMADLCCALQQRLGVPVIDGVAAAVKQAPHQRLLGHAARFHPAQPRHPHDPVRWRQHRPVRAVHADRRQLPGLRVCAGGRLLRHVVTAVLYRRNAVERQEVLRLRDAGRRCGGRPGRPGRVVAGVMSAQPQLKPPAQTTPRSTPPPAPPAASRPLISVSFFSTISHVLCEGDDPLGERRMLDVINALR